MGYDGRADNGRGKEVRGRGEKGGDGGRKKGEGPLNANSWIRPW